MTRDKIIEVAMSWLGTPYHHQAGTKGVGVDCAYFVGKVAEEIACITHFEVEPYSTEWHWHNEEEKMCAIVESFGAIRVDSPLPGDIIAFKYGRACSHLGILVQDNRFIHAHLPAGKVTLNSLTGDFAKRAKRYYRFPNIEV